MRFSRLTRWFRGWFRRSTKPSRNRHETVHETITKPSVLKFYGGGGGEKNKKKYKVNFLQVIKGRSRAIMGRSIDRSIIDRSSIDRSIDRSIDCWKSAGPGRCRPPAAFSGGRHLSGPPDLMNMLEIRVAGNRQVLENAVHRRLIRPSTMPRLLSPRRDHVQI